MFNIRQLKILPSSARIIDIRYRTSSPFYRPQSPYSESPPSPARTWPRSVPQRETNNEQYLPPQTVAVLEGRGDEEKEEHLNVLFYESLDILLIKMSLDILYKNIVS